MAKSNICEEGELFSHILESLCCTLFLMLLCLQVSPKLALAAAGSRVEYLPGFERPLPFELETGYIGVDDSEDVQLFYYFIKSESNPSVDPLLLWLTGGPGCSSLFGLLFELGPLNFEAVEYYNGNIPRLVLNPNSWTEVASIIFLDLPVGTGFSYARTPNARQSTDLQTTHQVYQFLSKFLIDHPEYTTNAFYIGGDSYSGLIIPMIAQVIDKGNENGNEPSINLKGYLLGNPLTRTPADQNYEVPFAHGMGLISDELYESLKRNCKGEYFNMDENNTLCKHDLQSFIETVNNINAGFILEPNCLSLEAKSQIIYNIEGRSLGENFKKLYRNHPLIASRCRTDGYNLEFWCNDESVREALHIHKGSTGLWILCNRTLPYKVKVWDNISYHAYLSNKGYRSLIYSGDHDMMVPFLATQAWIRSLNFSIVDDWRPWNFDGQVAGLLYKKLRQ